MSRPDFLQRTPARRIDPKTMNAKKAAWWERVRTRGVWQFILTRGMLVSFGGAALFFALAWLSGFPDTWFEWQWSRVLKSLALTIGVGVFWGAFTFWEIEWSYQRYLRRRKR